MELKEAIKILNDFKNTGYHMIMIKNNWDRITTNRKIETAIDTILKELEDRISKEKIETYFNTAMNECEDSFDWFDLENLKQNILRKDK